MLAQIDYAIGLNIYNMVILCIDLNRLSVRLLVVDPMMKSYACYCNFPKNIPGNCLKLHKIESNAPSGVCFSIQLYGSHREEMWRRERK